MSTIRLSVGDVQFVKELYPRLRESDEVIARYRSSIDKLPPIVVARGRVLVDGYHRWKATQQENISDIEAEDLGNLTDIEIIKESIRRNSTHGHQLISSDKKRMADVLYRQGCRDMAEMVSLLSITQDTLDTYLRDARKDEKQAQQEKAWDLWLDCWSLREIEKEIGVDQATVDRWVSQKREDPELRQPPASRQHFDVWQFATADGESKYFGKMPPQIVENLLWLYTDPGDIVVDPFAGGGTTIDVAKTMGRRIWASDIAPQKLTLPIHTHNILDGWPKDAPTKAKFIVLDPPYWKQAQGRYSQEPGELAEMSLEDFYTAWSKVFALCSTHLMDKGLIAYIISPTQLPKDDGHRVIDHATEMLPKTSGGFRVHRRIIATYNTQQATGQQVEWARDNKMLLKQYRDIVVMERI
jgi:hypothetical protein